ncbi:MAG: hypothetical protein PHF05_00240 [Candidatus Izemoplasmatales bacterium]|nr:hypothetical protein [Candidatus Izemoplasmatales bacterium]
MERPKLHFVRIEEPLIDLISNNVHSDFAAKNLAIIHDGSVEFTTVNALALKEALLNTPELLKLWGYKLVKIEEEVKPTKVSKAKDTKKVEPLIDPDKVQEEKVGK